jgi:DNA-binding transcriptional ArsR family regulator
LPACTRQAQNKKQPGIPEAVIPLRDGVSPRADPRPAVGASDSHGLGLKQLARVLGTLILTPTCVSANLPLVVTYEVDPWDALGDGTRRAIFKRLVEGPRSVGELASDLPVSRPAVSQHLRVLKDAGLVSDRAAGTRRVYAVHPAGLATLRDDLDRFWTQALDAFKAVAEKPPRGQREKQKEKKR